MNIYKNKKYFTKYIFDIYLGLMEIFGVNGSSTSLKDRSSKNCTTVSGGSPNKPCIFPWKYNGIERQTCTLGSSMSFYSNFISILSWFYPNFSRYNFYKVVQGLLVLVLEYFHQLYHNFILILSWFFIKVTLFISTMWIKLR